jgi:ATP-dependent exoDNAse (exonuclease V) beta subunit
LPQAVTVPSIEPLGCSAAADSQAASTRAAAHARVLQPSWSVSSVTAEARHLERVTEAIAAAVDDPTKVVTRNTAAHRADAGIAWGTLIHGLLEHAMRHKAAKREDLRRLGMWLTCEEPHLRKVLDDAIDTVLRLAESGLWRAAKAAEHSEETPFTVRQANGALSNGVIDLIFKGTEGWHVRDYKTDVLLDPAAYDRQLDSYSSALEALNCTVKDVRLIHIRPRMETT